MSANYSTSQTLMRISGTPAVFAPPPSTLATTTLYHIPITVPLEALGNPTFETTIPGSIIILQRLTQGYVVLQIRSATTSSTPLDTSTANQGAAPPTRTTLTNASPTIPSTQSGARASGQLTTEPTQNSKKTDSKNTAAAAVAGVMGALFAITLAALLFLIFKRRKAAKDSSHSPPAMIFPDTNSAKGQSTISELNSRNTDLMNQLEERNTQLSALQATLMRSNSVPPSLDDRSIASRFKQLEQELKDWIIIHFKSTEQRPDLSPELREILISQVPLFDRLLQQPRSRTMVLRAVAGHVIQKAFESGEFVGVGDGLVAMETGLGRHTAGAEFNKWRSQTFLILSKAFTTESKAQVVTTISQRIDNLLSPFATTASQPERLHFLSRIVESAVTLSLDLGCQIAKFKVLSEPAETPFRCAHMEDVYQEHETHVDPHTGQSVNALDGKIIQAVVFPSVIKWGNERGENYDEMKVLLKARVLA